MRELGLQNLKMGGPEPPPKRQLPNDGPEPGQHVSESELPQCDSVCTSGRRL